MLNVEKGDIFTFSTLPDWAEYENIYFIVNSESDTGAEDDKELNVSVIVEFENHMVKGKDTGIKLTSDDMKTFNPVIVEDNAKLAKILLVE